MSDISRQAYADMFGPTTGDKVRLADTELWIEVEDDLTTYGEEVKFGGGKVIRAGLRRHHHDRRRDRPGGGHQRHDLHARAVVHLADAAGRGQPAGQYWPAG